MGKRERVSMRPMLPDTDGARSAAEERATTAPADSSRAHRSPNSPFGQSVGTRDPGPPWACA